MRTREGVMMPRRATTGSAGYDFFAPEDIELKAGKWVEVDSGVFLSENDTILTTFYEKYIGNMPNAKVVHEFELGRWVFLVVPKSGLGFNYCVRLANTTGVIDSDYVNPDDEIRAQLTCEKDITIKKDHKYMQGIFVPYGVLSDEIKPTKSRTGGFGSTGQ